MRYHCPMSILVAAAAIFVAVSPVWATIAAPATREVSGEDWREAAFSPASLDQSASPSPQSEVGQSNGSKEAQAKGPKEAGDSKDAPAADAKLETPVQPESAGARGATNSTVSKSEGKRKITFKPAFRLQVRENYDTANDQNDLFIARLRFKAKGEIFRLFGYYAEVKMDNLGRRGKDSKVQPEAAWFEHTVTRDFALRAGLFKLPFSRNALTSDTKLLLMDRSLIKDALTSFGLADNTEGLLSHGRPFGGHLEYAVGIFNNDRFRKIGAPGPNRSDSLMPAGRFVVDFLEPAARGGYGDYQTSDLRKARKRYIGTHFPNFRKPKRLALGTNFARLTKAHDTVNEFNLFGWGTDILFSSGRFTFEGEYDRFRKALVGGNSKKITDGWYLQTGYLAWRPIEFTFRHQQLDPDVLALRDKTLRWTSVGTNIYIRGNDLKLQLDYTFRRGPGQVVKTGVLEVQLQIKN